MIDPQLLQIFQSNKQLIDVVFDLLDGEGVEEGLT